MVIVAAGNTLTQLLYHAIQTQHYEQEEEGHEGLSKEESPGVLDWGAGTMRIIVMSRNTPLLEVLLNTLSLFRESKGLP